MSATSETLIDESTYYSHLEKLLWPDLPLVTLTAWRKTKMDGLATLEQKREALRLSSTLTVMPEINPAPGSPRWGLEETDIDSRHEGQWVQIVPVLKSPLCSPVRFAAWHVDKSDPVHYANRKAYILKMGQDAFAVLADEVKKQPAMARPLPEFKCRNCGDAFHVPRFAEKCCGRQGWD